MKNRTIKKILAVTAVMAAIAGTSVPALAADDLVTAKNHFGQEYQIDFNKGAADIGGRHIYFGFTAESDYVKVCGWKGAVGLKAAELADLMVVSPDWWAWYSAQFPTVDEHYAWISRG